MTISARKFSIIFLLKLCVKLDEFSGRKTHFFFRLEAKIIINIIIVIINKYNYKINKIIILKLIFFLVINEFQFFMFF